jgi:hypothetical protein
MLFKTVIVGLPPFGILMDFQLIIDCGEEGRFRLQKSHISVVLHIFLLNRNRRKEFLLTSFQAFEVVFLLGCCTLLLGVHCTLFQDHIVASSSRMTCPVMNILLQLVK